MKTTHKEKGSSFLPNELVPDTRDSAQKASKSRIKRNQEHKPPTQNPTKITSISRMVHSPLLAMVYNFPFEIKKYPQLVAERSERN